MNKTLWLGPYRDPNLNIEACKVIKLLGNHSRTTNGQLLYYVSQLFSADDGITVDGGIGSTYGFVLVRNEDTMLMFLYGARTDQQRQDIVDEWTASDPFTSSLGVSRNAYRVAMSMTSEHPEAFFNGVKHLRVFGYSFGGMVAAALVALANQTQGALDSMAISYGSPKAGNEKFSRLMQRYGSCRFMYQDDDIPALPPKPADAPATTILVFGGINWSILGQWVHVVNGWRLAYAPTAVMERCETIPVPTPTIFPSLFQVFGPPAGVEFNHDLARYDTFFDDFRSQTGAYSVTTEVPPDAPQKVTPTLRTRIRNEGTDIIRADAANPSGVLRNRQITIIPAGDPTRYRALRTKEGFWLVARGSDIEGIGPGKRTAKTLARRLNKAARRG